MSDQPAASAEHKISAAPSGGGRRSACPGLFRIVPSRDGGICRVKLRRGVFTSEQARRLADLSAAHGSGVVEATNRSNFQIRGIRAGTEAGLIAALVDAGFGASGPGADDVRNLMVSPMAGTDPERLIDVRQLADASLDSLEAGTAYHALSPKFSILVDGGEAMAMASHPHDLWLSAVDGGTFAFGFSGCPPLKPGDLPAAGSVPAECAHAALLAILDLFLEFAGSTGADGTEITRMRHLCAILEPAGLVAKLQTRLPFPLHPAGATKSWRRRKPAAMAHVGIAAERSRGEGGTARVAAGAVPPLGRLDPAMLRGLSEAADRYSGGILHLTPWQSVLLPGVAAGLADEVIGELARLGLMTRADRALASMIACAGSAGCASGLADTKADALRLAGLLDADGDAPDGIHLTGCAKSCAAPLPAPVTLLGVAPGRYDLFLREDGNTRGPGKPLAAGITIEQARSMLARQPRRARPTVAE